MKAKEINETIKRLDNQDWDNMKKHIDKKFASENILDDILNLNIKKETNYKYLNPTNSLL